MLGNTRNEKSNAKRSFNYTSNRLSGGRSGVRSLKPSGGEDPRQDERSVQIEIYLSSVSNILSFMFIDN